MSYHLSVILPILNYFNYFTEIEETFIRRRGKHLLLSPLDWALIESWQEREIPLRIVLRGIESVFDSIDKNPNRSRTVKSLSYCREEIEAQYQDWLGAQVGKPKKETEESVEIKQEQAESANESTLFSDEAIKSHLENISGSIKIAKEKSSGELQNALNKIATNLSEYKKTKTDAEALEEALSKMEEQIDKTLLDLTDEKRLGNLKTEIAKELSPHKLTMEKEVYERTFDLMLVKKLREDAEIPPLSLFYL